MKSLKIILLVIAVIAVVAGAYFLGMKKGSDLVRNGIVANYPTVKNVVQSGYVEIDSNVSIALTPADDSVLFHLLSKSKTDTIQFSVPYYGRYGIDMSFRNFRVFKDDEGNIEVWLPAETLRYCELKFDALTVNGKPVDFPTAELRKRLYEYLIPVLEKNKSNQKRAKTATTKSLMYYFMPYQYGLTLYIDEEQQTLPLVPGINQSVDDAIKQAVGK